MDPSAPCKTYVFPGSAAAELHAKNKARGHFRSASHGGTSLTNPSVTRAPANSAAIDLLEAAAGIEKASQENVPQAKPGGILRHGHTRALSQGQIPSQQGHQKGHARTGSKTDFVLPAGHQDKDTPTHHRQASRTQSAEAFQRTHSRQASRTESIYTLRPTRIPWSNRLFFWKKSPAPQMPRMRTIVPNHLVPPRTKAKNHPNRSFADNCIRTSKYTLLSFLPKNLLEQFHRFANLYFLFIVLLNWIPAVNAFGKEVAMIPVIFVLGVTAIKDAYEDHRRHRSDKRINGTTCRVYSREQDRYVRVRFDQLRVGDIVHLSCDEIIPADMLILRSSDEHGLCFIETSNLDGENNLKQRSVAPGMVGKQSEFDPKKFVSTLECEAPTTKIYQFNGAMVHPKGARVPLTRDNLLLRDCVLKNTDFVEGIVVYAGHESKAMLNHGGPRYKMTQLEQAMNLDVVWCVVILVLLCLSGACGCGLWLNWYVPLLPVPFLPLGDFGRPGEEPMSAVEPDPFYQAFLAFWTYVIILQVMIPLSLYVTIEMTKLAQVFHIQNDDELKDPVTGKQIECRALNITEELGQIQYVFSDKTGTLTENNMIFRRCSVGGIDYNHPHVGKVQPDVGKVGERQRITPNSRLEEVLRQFEMQRATEAETPEGERVFQLYIQARRLQEFFLLMAVCNTVVVAKHRHKDAMNESGVVESAAEDMSTASLESGANSVSSTMVLVESADSLGCAPVVIPESMSATPKRSKIFSGRHSARYRPSNHMQQRPLSPIDSSCETTPTESPAPIRPRFLQLPTFASAQSFFMLRRSSTPTSDVSAVTPTEKKPLYEAESPDELALIDAACAYNIKLLQRSPHHVSVSVPGEGVLEFRILKVLPFDSTRKRMSVVLRHPQTQKIIVYCKGADSAIFPRLAYTRSFAENQIIAKTEQHVNQYAKQGLRTLLMAKRVLTEQEYNSWLELHQEAELAADSRERLLYESYCRLERELQLLGATGIEDKLQDGVPETISALRNAGMVVWVLTGDKQETAINIAYACSLFSGEMEVLKLNARSKSAAESAIHCYLDDIQRELAAAASAEETANRLRAFFPLASQGANILLRKRALVVDGKTLLYILDKRSNLQKPFLHLTRHCAAVLCCRATPLQKAFIVKIVKQQLRVRTLGIGDGANDVSMIQTADVGIGISGAEGMQAVMASDFAIPRFRFLHRLLLVHGHWCYDRLARMVLYFFYKNANFVFVIFWYQMYCGFSGNVMIDQLYLMFFNLFFTSLPPLAMGIYDQVAPAEILSSEPPLYAASREGRHYRSHSFWVNIADALYQSTVIFFIAYFAYNESEVDLWEFGTVITTCCIFVMVLHIAMDFRSWTWLHGASVLLSIVLFLAFALAYNAVCVDCSGLPNPYWVMQHCMTTPIFWTVLLLVCVLSMLPRFVAKALSAVLAPSEVMKSLLNHRSRQRNKGELTVAWSRNSTTLTVVHTTETGTTLAQS